MGNTQKKNSTKIAGEIERWTKNLEVLRGDLVKAQKVQVKSRKSRDEIVLEARTGNQKAQGKVDKLRETLFRAEQDQEELTASIAKCEEKIEGLKRDYAQACLDEFNERRKKVFKGVIKDAEEVDTAIAEAFSKIDKMLAPAKALQEEANELGVIRNFSYTLDRTVGHHVIWKSWLRESWRRDIDRPHQAYRKDSLVESVKSFLEGLSDHPELREVREEPVIKVDLTENCRVVPREEAEEQSAMRAQMKTQAESLRKEGVPA